MSRQPLTVRMLNAACLLAALVFSVPVAGQVDVALSPVKSLVGVTSPQQWGSRLLVGVDSSVNVASGMMLTVTTEWPVVIVARCNGTKIEPETSADHKGQFLFLANGNYVVDIVAFGDKPFTRTVEFQIVSGHSPQPPPDPQPDPEPDPKPDVRNEYGVGLVASNAPESGRATVAGIYRQAAGYLRGIPDGELKHIASDNGTSTDTSNVLVWIRVSLDRTSNTPEWKEWRKAVAAALVESQKARTQFSSDDWYKAFMEIADGVAAK